MQRVYQVMFIGCVAVPYGPGEVDATVVARRIKNEQNRNLSKQRSPARYCLMQRDARGSGVCEHG
jgi:hypothetical protein